MKTDDSKLIVVSSSVLPDVFIKVLEVKKMLANKEEKSSAAACKRIGISRSAYYKYKDCVFCYEEKFTQRIINIYAVLKDEQGVLSSVLQMLNSMGANILTLNQNIPMDGVAGITLTLRMNGDISGINEIKSRISDVKGVVEVKIISGE